MSRTGSGEGGDGSFWAGMSEFVPNLRDPPVTSALRRLVVFSLSIIVLPLTSMVFLKKVVLETGLGWEPSDALLWSAVAAVVLVHVVLFAFVYAAWADGEATPHAKAQRQAQKID